ncbi:MAG: hypothetical protein Q9227_005350 [Pyrenula ochraceoflavens]
MLGHRRSNLILFLAGFVFILLYVQVPKTKTAWRELPQVVGLGEYGEDEEQAPLPTSTATTVAAKETATRKGVDLGPLPTYAPGTTKPPGSNYSRTLVIAKTKEEDTNWLDELLPDVDKATYIADDITAPLHPPTNKGHEVMIYLSYIVDHYDNLPDIMIFMHAHRWTWHNNDMMNYDAVEMVQRLSSERVTREGFMNMRCHWEPGCPDWIHPGTIDEDINKPEEVLVAESWSELFPTSPIPRVLAGPCCGQFALSRERVHSIPRSRFVFYREWLLRTGVDDYKSGRVWEYIWQFVFTGHNTWCPVQHECYCDAYGLCFGGEDNFEKWFERRKKKDDLEEELDDWKEKALKVAIATANGHIDEAADIVIPELGRDKQIAEEMDDLQKKMDAAVDEAIQRGNDPRNRAIEAGREWHEGDGF